MTETNQALVLDLAAVRFDDALVLFHKRVDLLLREVLPGKKHMFV